MPRNGRKIEGVHGLAVLLHHIVGDVHQIVDGADAAGRKPSLHPPGGRADFDIFADPCAVSWTQFLILHFHGNIILRLLTVSRYRYLGQYKGLSESCRRLSGNTDYTVTVYAV